MKHEQRCSLDLEFKPNTQQGGYPCWYKKASGLYRLMGGRLLIFKLSSPWIVWTISPWPICDCIHRFDSSHTAYTHTVINTQELYLLAFPLSRSQTLNTVSWEELWQGTVVGLLGSWWIIKISWTRQSWNAVCAGVDQRCTVNQEQMMCFGIDFN